MTSDSPVRLTPKQRMLLAYRWQRGDRPPVAPEFWYYYPAKLLGVDMIEFQRHVPFHQALKKTFETFDCEGWGIGFCHCPAADIKTTSKELRVSDSAFEVCRETKTPFGVLTSRHRFDKFEPSWCLERAIKDIDRDLPAWRHEAFGDIGAMDVRPLVQAWEEVGESYLLEGYLGVPFFDFYAGDREGGLEQAIFDFLERPALFEELQRLYIDWLVRKAEAICRRTPVESFFLGCSWSCNSLIGPAMWRRWDKPVIAAVARELHRRGRLLHVHLHGKCMETVADLAEIGVDCVCPFERSPGGDVVGLEGLKEVRRRLKDKVTFNGNVHTVETLIRGRPEDARREVGEILKAFTGSPRLIVGTGDQVGRETPEENLHAMIEAAKRGL